MDFANGISFGDEWAVQGYQRAMSAPHAIQILARGWIRITYSQTLCDGFE